MPMIATTIISSMRVKPRWLPIFFVQNRIIVESSLCCVFVCESLLFLAWGYCSPDARAKIMEMPVVIGRYTANFRIRRRAMTGAGSAGDDARQKKPPDGHRRPPAHSRQLGEGARWLCFWSL
jgi:hypothetical protein